MRSTIQKSFLFFIFYYLIINIHADAVDSNLLVVDNNDIVFDLPDITASYKESTSSVVQLEAYKASLNDAILKRQNQKEYGQLSWVSFGNPRLVRTASMRQNKIVSSLFHFTPEGFYAYVDMLTKSQTVTLVKAIKTKYKIDIVTDQIQNLVLSRFQCQLSLLHSNKRDKIVLIGKVTEFHNYPLRMNFWTPVNSVERVALQQRLSEYDSEELVDLHFECEIASRGKELKTTTLVITANQMSGELQVIEKIFGVYNSTVFATRTQLNKLASELYTSLDILEEYQIPLHTFIEELTSEIISQTFIHVPFDEAWRSLSNYSRDYSNTIDLGKLFELKTEVINDYATIDNNSTTHGNSTTKNSNCIQLNEENYQVLKLNDDCSFLGIIKLSGVINATRGNLSECLNLNISLSEQLEELNNATQSGDIQWMMIEKPNKQIIPKSIYVAKLDKSSFSKGFTFNRIRKQHYDVSYSRKVSLYTKKFTDTQTASSLNVNPKFPIGTIVAVSSRSVLFWFDENGKGFGDYLGWFVCDGRNETPNLTRKFLVGSDTTKENYDQVGKSGGLDYVLLNVDKLPIYQINIEGLQSVNDIEMNKAKISYSSDSLVYENRPMYHVVTYIIYLDI